MSEDACHHPELSQVLANHPRQWETMHYIYLVISRRAGGLSVGINLNTNQVCNFNCVYCCVDRTATPDLKPMDLEVLDRELRMLLEQVASGELWRYPAFADVPEDWRHLCDLAFSGDGEPTACSQFEQAIERVALIKKQMGLDGAKLVLITNATMLDRPRVARGVARLDAAGGEVWAKLDAGTPAYYQKVDRSAVPLKRVLSNLLACGQARPIVLQTMLMKMRGQPMPPDQFEAYLDRVDELVQQGCQIKAVQLYTVARQTAESWVTPLEPAQLSHFESVMKRRFPSLDVGSYA